MSYRLTFLSFTLVLTTAMPHARAQAPVYEVEHITADNGGPTNRAFHIHEDEFGFLWLATINGLIRYDGLEFKQYQDIKGDSLDRERNVIKRIEEDENGNYWLATDVGVSVFDPRTEVFEEVATPGYTSSIALSKTNPDRLWVVTPSSINSISISSRSVENRLTNLTDSLGYFGWTGNGQHGLLEDSRGMVWIGLSWGLCKYDPGANTIKRFMPNPRFPVYRDEDSPTNHGNHTGPLLLSPYDDNTLWVGSRRGLYRFDMTFERFESFSGAINQGEDGTLNVADRMVTSLNVGSSGVFYVGTRGRTSGVYTFDVDTGQHALKTNTQRRNFNNQVHEGKNGLVWIASNDGLRRLTKRPYPFTIYLDPADSTSIFRAAERGVGSDPSGNILIGSSEGLIRIDKSKKKAPELIASTVFNRKEVRDLGMVLSVFTDSRNQIWIGKQNGLIKYDVVSGAFEIFEHDPHNPDGIANGTVDHIIEDNEGKIWMMTFLGGLNQYDPETGKFKHFRHNPDDPNSLADNWATRMYIPPSTPRKLWVVSRSGLSRFDLDTHTFENYLANSLEGSNDLLEDSKNRFWVGSESGLHLFDRQQGQVIRSYSEKDGLPFFYVPNIFEDEQGFLWAGTGDGLARFDPESEIFETFTTKDGLPGNRFGQHGYFKSELGELFYLTQNVAGLNWISFNPSDIDVLDEKPVIALTDLEIEGNLASIGQEEPLEQSIAFTNTLTLSYNQDELTFHYAGLGTRDPSQIQYQYYLENYDDDWVETGSVRSARYNQLPPGDYVFHVKGSFEDDVWSEPRSLAITIHPPWWKTTFAYLLYGILLVGGVVSANLVQRRRLIAKERQLTQIREAELKAEAAQALSREATAMVRESEAQSKALEEENRRKQVELEKAKELEQAHAALETSYEDLQQTHTQLQETQEQLIHAEKMASLGQLTAGIAHEIKNPLNFVNNFSQLSLGMMEELQHFLHQLGEQPGKQPHGRTPVSAQPDPEQPASEGEGHLDRSPERSGEGQTRGSATNGSATNGSATNGSATNGSATNGSATNGSAEGESSAGSTPTWDEAMETLELLMMNAEKIAHHGQRADGIVRAMIEHSRTGPGERRPVDMNQLLDEHVQLAYHGMQAREEGFAVELVCDYDEAIGEVEVVPQELGRVFINLLNNAFDAVREKAQIEANHVPRVHIQTVHREAGIEIQIKDNGVGIPDQVRDKVFQPFFTTKPAGSGSTGLGLSLSHDIVVKGHGGSLGVESEEGKGAAFLMGLPY